jgi:hypothetical protein
MKLRILTAAYLIFLGGAAFIFAKSEYRQLLNFMSAIPYWDKYFHFFATGTLSFFLNTVLGCRVLQIGKVGLPWGTMAVALMSVLEEWSQSFIPGRVFDIWDIAAAVSGTVVFGWLALYFHKHPLRVPEWLKKLQELPAADMDASWIAFRGATAGNRHWWKRAGEREKP